MSDSRNKVPAHVKTGIAKRAAQLADEIRYSSMTMKQRSAALAIFCNDPQIGGVLTDYIEQNEVRQYIKDNLVRALSQGKNKAQQPTALEQAVWCEKKYKTGGLQVVHDSKYIVLLKNPDTKDYIVVGRTTYRRWESALRFALLFIAGRPFGKDKDNNIRILLSLSRGSSPITDSDLQLLRDALARASADVRIVG